MRSQGVGHDSLWVLRADLLSAHVLVWIASVGREGELTAEAHAFFCDRYSRLAECYRGLGRMRAAGGAEAKASQHCPGDGPPYAAAMAQPRPDRWVRTWAVSGRRDPDDAA
jgi:hypothetical protein